MKRKIGEVYEFPYKCGHLAQHTLLLPAHEEPNLVLLNRIVAWTAEQNCLICDRQRKPATRADV
jgi:hypothetical protein